MSTIGPKSISLLATATVTPNAGTILAATSYTDPDTVPGAEVVDPPPYELAGNTWAVDAEGVTAALARGVIQQSRLEVYVDGVIVPASELVGEISVDRRRDRAVQTWAFDTAVDATTGMGPFGNPLTQLGPPLGKRLVSIYAVYRTAAGVVYRYPLLVNGLCDSYSGSSTRVEHLESHSGVDALGCLSRSLVNYVKAPGQRIPRHEAIRDMFIEAGATSFALDTMKRTNKPLQYVDADPVSAAQELCEVEGRQIQAGPAGEIRNPKLRGKGAAQWVIRESDLLSFSLSAPGDVITRVTVNGTEYVAGGEEGCAAQTAEQRQTTDTIYRPRRLRWQQAANCVITDLGDPAYEPQLIQTRLVIHQTVKRCGVLVAEVIDVWEWHSRETWRYERAAIPTDLKCRLNARFLEGNDTPAANGSEPSNIEHETWRHIQRTATVHAYDLPGWQVFNAPPGKDSFHTLSGHMDITRLGGDVVSSDDNYRYRGTNGNGFFGAYLGSITVESQFYAVRAAIKERLNVALTWDEEDYLAGVRVLGSGDGVEDTEEFQPVRSEVRVVHSNTEREIQREVVRVASFAARRGRRYLYGDDTTRADVREVLVQTTEDETLYLEGSESTHRAIISHSNLIVPGFDSVVSEDRDGALPQVDILPFMDEEILTEIEANGGTFVSKASIEAAMTRHGTKDENKSFSVPVTATNLELRHCVKSDIRTESMIEDEQEAQEYGKMLIAESSALPVTVEILLNGVMDEVDAATLYYRPRGIDGRRLEFRGLNHRHSARREMPTTIIEGRLYLDGV